MDEMYRNRGKLSAELIGAARRESAPLSQGRTAVFLACMPKTASTFAVKALSRATGFETVNLVDVFRDNEQNLYLPKLIDTCATDMVLHQHCKATNRNLELMVEYNIRPVILVRDLLDILVSLYDHFHNESPISPFAFAYEGFFDLDEEGRKWLLVRMAAPWLVQFYASWYTCSALKKQINTFWLSYADFMANKTGAMASILDYYGLEHDHAVVGKALEEVSSDRSGTRFNVGRQGRGKDFFSLEQKKCVAAFLECYPAVDFSLVNRGLA